MQKKKSKFWLFIFSFIPGAGEMYMGFMKMGVSLMLGFGAMVAFVGFMNLGVLVVFPVVMYIYSFFHAHNLRSLDDEAFYGMRDQYLFGLEGLDDIEMLRKRLGGKYKKIAAAVLIIIGVVMLWQTAFNMLYDILGDNYYLNEVYWFMARDLPRIVIGIAVIWCGIVMIRGKRVVDVVEMVDSESAGYKNMGVNQAAMGMQDGSAGQTVTGALGESDERDETVR